MIKDAEYFARWEREFSAREKPDYEKNLRIFEAMIEHARRLGVWPPADPLEGIEVDIKLAKVINALRTD